MNTYGGNTLDRSVVVGIAVVCVAQFVVVLDVTIVVSALPAVRRSLGFTEAGLPWVVTTYTLVLGGLLVSAGRVADRVGARRVFLVGLLGFAASSACCALAWAPWVLLVARVAQGAGAALLGPAALALLTGLSAPGEARRRALGWWTAAAAGGGASGWVLGGLVTEHAGWRWVFGINVPVALVAALVAVRVLPAGGRRTGGGSLDLTGALLATGGVSALVLGLGGVADRGAGAALVWAPLLAAVVLLGLFVPHERRHPDPMLPGSLVRSRAVVGANLTAVALTAATSPAMYLATLWAQEVLGLPADRASLLFPAFNLSVIAGSLAGPRTLGRWGARRSAACGLAGVAAGAVLLVGLPTDELALDRFLVSFALMGAGLGVASVASTEAGTSAAAEDARGVASGVLSAAAQLGTALGLAVVVPLAAALAAAPDDGHRVGFAAAGAIALLGVVAARLLPTRDRDAVREPAGSPSLDVQ